MANALALLFAHRRGDAIGKVAQALAQCHHPQAFALSAPVEQGVNCDRSPWRTEAETPISLSGSLLSAWRKQ
jgi:hypothetical protein